MSRSLSRAERALIDARIARDAARATLIGTVGRLKGDASPKRITARLKADAAHAARNAAMDAIDIIADERGIVAGTVAALVGWLARRPIAAGARALWCRVRGRPAGDDS